MPLTVLEINAAKPGLRPVKQRDVGQKDKQLQSKGEISVQGRDSTGNEQDSGFVKTDKPYKMADGGGLYLEVDPSGGKYWRFKYRFPKEKRISLGVYPDVGLADARKERDKCREQLAKGIDPGVARKAQKASRLGNAANSFEVVSREWLKTYVDSKAESHRKRVYARFENDIFPQLGRRPIVEITPMELLGVIKKIEDRGAGDTAHRTLGSCGQVSQRYRLLEGISQFEVARRSGESREKLIQYWLNDNETFCSNTSLTAVCEPAEYGHFNGMVKIRILEHDECVAASKLHGGLLHVFPSPCSKDSIVFPLPLVGGMLISQR